MLSASSRILDSKLDWSENLEMPGYYPMLWQAGLIFLAIRNTLICLESEMCNIHELHILIHDFGKMQTNGKEM